MVVRIYERQQLRSLPRYQEQLTIDNSAPVLTIGLSKRNPTTALFSGSTVKAIKTDLLLPGTAYEVQLKDPKQNSLSSLIKKIILHQKWGSVNM